MSDDFSTNIKYAHGSVGGAQITHKSKSINGASLSKNQSPSVSGATYVHSVGGATVYYNNNVDMGDF